MKNGILGTGLLIVVLGLAYFYFDSGNPDTGSFNAAAKVGGSISRSDAEGTYQDSDSNSLAEVDTGTSTAPTTIAGVDLVGSREPVVAAMALFGILVDETGSPIAGAQISWSVIPDQFEPVDGGAFSSWSSHEHLRCRYLLHRETSHLQIILRASFIQSLLFGLRIRLFNRFR